MDIQEIIKALIAGAKVKFVPNGTTIDTNVVSDTYKPEADSPVWGSLGRTESGIPVRDKDTKSVVQFGYGGDWETDEKDTINSNKFQFTTRDFAFTTLRLMFGLEKQSDGTWKPYRGNGAILGWMQVIITDSDTKEDLVAMEFYGRLSLTALATFQNDIVSSTYQLAVIRNDLELAEGITGDTPAP